MIECQALMSNYAGPRSVLITQIMPWADLSIVTNTHLFSNVLLLPNLKLTGLFVFRWNNNKFRGCCVLQYLNVYRKCFKKWNSKPKILIRKLVHIEFTDPQIRIDLMRLWILKKCYPENSFSISKDSNTCSQTNKNIFDVEIRFDPTISNSDH